MSATAPSSRLQAGLKELRAGFLDRVTARCLAIEAIVAGAPDDADAVLSEAERKLIREQAHKTAGVAATFGFADLGAQASAVEELMSVVDPAPTWGTAGPAIEALLDEMERALDAEV